MKALADQIREEKMGLSGATNRGAILSLLSMLPEKIFVSDTLTVASGYTFSETVTSTDTVTASSKNSGSYVIDTAQINYSDIA